MPRVSVIFISCWANDLAPHQYCFVDTSEPLLSRIKTAARIVKSGGVIVYPTETVFGIGGDPENIDVLERVRKIKGSDRSKPMLMLTDEWDRVDHYITGVTDLHRSLMMYEPRLPITLLFEASERVPQELKGSSSFVGIRRTPEPVCLQLISECGMAIVSTSANRSGKDPVDTFAALDPDVLSAVDYAIDVGRKLPGTPSTVASIRGKRIVIHREGPVSLKDLREVTNSNTTG